MVRYFEIVVLGVATAFVVAVPALAAPPPPATPLPVVGLGLPAIALFGLAYRRLRNRSED